MYAVDYSNGPGAMAGSLGHKKEISRGYAALFAMNAIFLKKKLVFTPTEFQK